MIDGEFFKFNLTTVFLLLIFCHVANSSNSIIPDEIDSPETTNLLLKAKYFEDNSKYDSSIFYYKKAEKNSILLNDWESQANCLIKISNIYKIQDDIIKAKEYISDAENIIRLHSDTNTILYAEVLHVKGSISLNQSDNTKSINFFNRCIDLKKKYYR